MISDAFIAKKQLEYDVRGVEKKEVRSYEVSLWTLQDTFITVLKWSDIQQRGRIENPRMTLSTDGTQSFEFSIPMYIRQDGELVENPNWYTMHDGNLLAATRKVKVIFNKGEDDEAVYEFIILDVTETHDNDILTCDVKCEGLAFHELGKVGYNYSLSQDDFILDYKNWAEGSNRDSTQEPIENLDYWCQKINLLPLKDAQVINPRQWYYKVEMGYANTSSASVVYEKPFAASWELDNDSGKLVATSLTESREKARPIEASQSNIYNITQSIAEAFQVFCRYEYGYDANYHIISRTVVFYNSLLMEQDGISSITYPYNSGHITRDKDATNLTTKLYVLNLEDESAFDGYRSIMNVDANKTRENYILNFDYMHEIGNVDDEQYEKISDYEKQWREINLELTRLQGNLAALQTQKPEIEGKLAVCKKSIEVGNEQISQNKALEAALVETYGDKTGQYIKIPENNPDTCFAYKQGNKYVVKLNSSNKGIDPKSVRVYLKFNSTATDPKQCLLNADKFNKHGKIKQIFDDAGNLTSLELKVTDTSSTFTMPSHVYLTYNYNPKLYYDKIIDMWGQRIAIDTRKRNQYEKQLYGAVLNGVNIEEADSQLGVPKLPGLLKKIENLENEIKSLMEIKQKSILEFEQMMGPALREGYWQPENYTDYGDQKQQDVKFNLFISGGAIESLSADLQLIIGKDIGDGCEAVWDDELFEDEDELFYYTGFESVDSSNSGKKAHYCVNLSDVNIPSDADLTQWSFAFDDDILSDVDDADTESYDNEIEKLHMFGFGSQAVIRYLVHEDTDSSTKSYSIIPVLVLLGDTGLAEYSLKNLTTKNTNQRIGNIQIALDNNNKPYTVDDDDAIDVHDKIFKPGAKDFLVYPRIKFSSLQLKTDTSSFFIGYEKGDKYYQLDRFSDYYFNTKLVSRTEKNKEGQNESNYYSTHFFTIKPDVLYQLEKGGVQDLTVNYILSNADTSIYLDALEVSKENAYPKVSYEVTPSLIDASISKKLYKQLARVIMINDTELKLEDTFGYISSIELNLDSPWEDTITVQNYTNKFEDLFSSIVAASEAMQKSQGMIGNMLAGGVPMSPDAFAESLNMNQTILDAYLDSHFDSSDVVADRLAELFADAAKILVSAQNAVNNVASLTGENASILGSFVQDIAADLTATVFRQATRPTQFKEGDIWIQTQIVNNKETEIGRYVATANSRDVKEDGGWTRVSNGTLAQIKGAALNVDSEAGIIDLKAENQINIHSGKDVDIAAGANVYITGNKMVDIGGGTINITGLYNNDNTSEHITSGGINLIASAINYKPAPDPNDSTKTRETLIQEQITKMIKSNIGTDVETNESSNILSKVLIHPDKIELGGADILMRGSNSIQMITSRNAMENTSVIKISPEEGIWVGSGAGIRLFAGNQFTVTQDANGNITSLNQLSGANVELLSNHLLFGVSQGPSATAVEMTNSYIAIGAGTASSNQSTTEVKGNVTGKTTGENNLVGVKIEKTSIGMTTTSTKDNVTTTNAFIMNDKGLTLGSTTNPGGYNFTTDVSEMRTYFKNNSNGSYVRINGDGIELGSYADLYINTSNFKLQTKSRQNTSMPNDGTILAIGTNLNGIEPTTDLSTLNTSNVRFLVNQKGAYINGTVYAAAGSIGNGAKKVDIGTSTNNNDSYICSGITSIPQNGPTTSGFYLGTDGFVVGKSDSYLKYTTSNGLTVQGAITATSGSIGSGSNKIIIGGNSSKAWIYHQLGSNAVPSGSTGGFYLGTDGFVVGDKNRYLQYTASGLTVKGDITATSFTLANNATILGGLSEQLTKYKNNDPGDAWTQVIELSGRKIVLYGSNGLYITGSLEAVNGVYYLNKSLTRITDKHICLDLNANNYVHINETGIAIKGSRISINGKEIWGRDDIIFSYNKPKKGRYPTDRDWIWIRPSANGVTEYEYTNNSTSASNSWDITANRSTNQGEQVTSKIYDVTIVARFKKVSTNLQTQEYQNIKLAGKFNNAVSFTTNVISSVRASGDDFSSAAIFACRINTTTNYAGNNNSLTLNEIKASDDTGASGIRFTIDTATISCLTESVNGGSQCQVLYYPAGTKPN